MNGRVYDYRLGRFLSVDPIISNPANSQSRRWKKGAGPWGRSWTTVDPRNVIGYRNLAGLPDANAGRFLSVGELQDSTGVMFRAAERVGNNVGGLPEVVVPQPALQIRLRSVLGLNPEFSLLGLLRRSDRARLVLEAPWR